LPRNTRLIEEFEAGTHKEHRPMSDPVQPQPPERPDPLPLPEDPPLREPEPERLPDELPDPGPGDTPQPPLQALDGRPLFGRPLVCLGDANA
jgi:hypothetical protein